ncbi:uncharacterized protein DUF1833 [Breoghania corrubedonensis]|uniref:Uncharacterized protein DUF1833 n=1 Tax=Breoghania corrubedonensis TaxID=665038 RepID=A0A2T5VCG6_9HYPH|nr:DUF1833 family protein [Breoghania corrubedonensis]PTW61437.1 uncharacterized protein DUF1833 [Breoghania corrubedonensis]
MPRLVSLNARSAQDATASDEVEVVLIRITHPDLDTTIRLSSDPTERLSLEPLTYGTRSTWQTDDGSPFLFVLLSTVLPDDQEETPPAATLILEVVDKDMAKPLRSTITRATVDFAVVLASDPDVIEAEWLGLELISAEGDSGQITLSISRDPITSEPWPSRRMTRDAFPGLHR